MRLDLKRHSVSEEEVKLKEVKTVYKIMVVSE